MTLPNARSLLRVVCRHRNDLSAQTVIDHASTFEGWNTTVGSALPNDRRAHTAIADAASKNRLVWLASGRSIRSTHPLMVGTSGSRIRRSLSVHLVGRHRSSTSITSAPRGDGFTTSVSPVERCPLDAEWAFRPPRNTRRPAPAGFRLACKRAGSPVFFCLITRLLFIRPKGYTYSGANIRGFANPKCWPFSTVFLGLPRVMEPCPRGAPNRAFGCLSGYARGEPSLVPLCRATQFLVSLT